MTKSKLFVLFLAYVTGYNPPRRGWTIAARRLESSDANDAVALTAVCNQKYREIGWFEVYYQNSNDAFATNLLVDVEHRRRGIGTDLLRHAEYLVSRVWCLDTLILTAQPDHLPSWSLYVKKRGFIPKAHLSAHSSSIKLHKQFSPSSLIHDDDRIDDAVFASIYFDEQLTTNYYDDYGKKKKEEEREKNKI
mmetsp:Transcript_3830/g.5345  ORF Transcript_3830/g.5345 Transcript_3830/m.5345 type:complete len:192 (+) Transcript_3830:178-753(+)